MESLVEKLAARPQRSILLLSLILLLVGNWILPLTDRDEARFAEASREMLQRGDYVVPWFNGHWRFDKPILIYWCQSASYRVLGVNGFAARLPSVLFTTATALLIVRWGRKAAGTRTAFMAAAMFLTGLHVAIIGRVATADMAMVFFTTLAFWSGWELTRPENNLRKVWWLVFYVALALGFLAKGPVAWLPWGGVVLGRILRPGSFRLPVGETALGICLTAALTAWWGIPALQQTGGEYFRVGMGVHVFQRSTAVNDGHGLKGWAGYILTAPLYFLTFLVSFLPWTIRRPEGELPELRALRQHGRGGAAAAWVLQRVSFILTIPIRIWRWWPTRKSDDLGWYLLGQALIVFGAFSLVRTKLPHYTMPAFPCIALWLALQLRGEAGAAAWFQKRLATMVVLVLILMLGGGAVVRHEFLTERLWVALKPYTQAETRIGFYGFNESSLVWKFRGVVTNTVTLGEEKNAKNFLTNAPPFILVLPTKDLPALGDISGLRIPVHGFDMVKIRNWDLTAIVRQQPGQ